jgi:hypothetical protein
MSDPALAAIRAVFSRTVEWTQSGEPVATVKAIVFYPDADDLPNFDGGSVSSRGYEVEKAALPFVPKKGDVVVDNGRVWRVIQRQDYDLAEAHRCFVEKTT